MPKASATSGVQLWRWIVPIAVGIIIWFLPVPAGLNPKAIHMLGIFLGTIAAILTNPMPSGAVMMTALAVSYFSGTLTLSQSLSGLASGTVWMIFSAYVLSLGFVQSGLGRRIAYLMLSKFGGSSTGIAYSLGCADLVMAPAMPSVTARSGGIILPIAKSINEVMGSTPGESGKKIGDYLIMTCFQVTPITGALFLTGMAANPLCAHLAKEGLGVDISWGTWLWAALLPAAICFVLLPHVTKFLVKPTMNKTPEAKALGKKMLGELGALTHQEKLVGIGFILALVGWATTMLTGYDANAIGLGVVDATEDPELRAARQVEGNRKYSKSFLALALPAAYCLLDAAGTFADNRVLETLDEGSANCAYELTFLFAAVLCFIYVVFIKKDRLLPKREAPKYIGAICETAGQFAYIYAIADTSHLAMSAPIISSYCAASVLWSRLFLKEKLSWKHYAMILLVVIGIAVMGVFDI